MSSLAGCDVIYFGTDFDQPFNNRYFRHAGGGIGAIFTLWTVVQASAIWGQTISCSWLYSGTGMRESKVTKEQTVSHHSNLSSPAVVRSEGKNYFWRFWRETTLNVFKSFQNAPNIHIRAIEQNVVTAVDMIGLLKYRRYKHMPKTCNEVKRILYVTLLCLIQVRVAHTMAAGNISNCLSNCQQTIVAIATITPHPYQKWNPRSCLAGWKSIAIFVIVDKQAYHGTGYSRIS